METSTKLAGDWWKWWKYFFIEGSWYLSNYIFHLWSFCIPVFHYFNFKCLQVLFTSFVSVATHNTFPFMNCGNSGTWLIFYWWLLGEGQLNSKTYLWIVCLNRGYYLKNGWNLRIAAGVTLLSWNFIPLRKLSMRFICENWHIRFTAIWKYIPSLSSFVSLALILKHWFSDYNCEWHLRHCILKVILCCIVKIEQWWKLWLLHIIIERKSIH